MKKTLVLVGIVTGAVGAYAQGEINWYDAQPGYTIEILSPNPASPTVEQTGQTSYDVPSGSTTVYGGGYIGGGTTGNGPNVGPTPTAGALGINYQNAGAFEAGLYLATSLPALTTDILTGSPVATTSLLGGANDGFYNNNPSGLTYLSSFAVNTPVYVGIAAWYNANGNTSYAASVVGTGVQGYVESTTTVSLGGGDNPPAGLAGLGLTSFSLATTPEPSTIALGVIGASAFLMRLRRKQ